MLAHQHAGLFNASALAGSLGVSCHTVQRYVDALEAVFLVRRLSPWFRNVGKRLTKAPKVYLRDTGLLHHLLNIHHPRLGDSGRGVKRDLGSQVERQRGVGDLDHASRSQERAPGAARSARTTAKSQLSSTMNCISRR